MLAQHNLAVLAVAILAVAGAHVPLNITAIASRDGYSVLECWQLASVPNDAMSAINYVVGDTTTATWSRIEPRTHVGEAWAPHVQSVPPPDHLPLLYYDNP